MSLRDIEIFDSYRSDDYEDLGIEFVSQLLAESVIYRRAVGFFSSSALIKLTKGLSNLTSREGARIEIVASPCLSEEDVQAIEMGYKNRAECIENALLREINEPKDPFEAERLNFLCHLIESGVLDIKIADRVSEKKNGIFHEKIGLFTDANGDSVSFIGSLNESDNSFSNNFESIQAYKEWEEPRRFNIIKNDFDKLWNNRTKTLNVFEFPEAAKRELFRYRKDSFTPDVDEWENRERRRIEASSGKPRINLPFELHEYQKNAINKWAKQHFRGLFNMGTGTGKTITALSASVKLLERLNYRLAVVIVCPYTHLVEQWIEEEDHFNLHFIVGYSNPKYANYQSKLSGLVQDFNDRVVDSFFFITTNSSFKTEKVQNAINNINGPALIIGDEVHNFGSSGMLSVLPNHFKYRIGLSATIDRHHDEDGTNSIRGFFGDEVINYGLEEAIQSNVLTRYYYYPILVPLTESEREEYLKITLEIKKNCYAKEGKPKLTKKGEKLAIKRARIIATAFNKISCLKLTIEPFKHEHNLLVYCGVGNVCVDEQDVSQIEAVSNLLGNELGMKIQRYTSKENAEERKLISNRYKDGNDLQAVVAIKCLDEGVNIPSIKTAFILASSTNPREYVQRRGRVLRRCKGKDYSYIYDFVTVPDKIESLYKYDGSYLDGFKTLIKNEIDRVKEFSRLSENGIESDKIINSLTEKFRLDEFGPFEDYEYIIEGDDYAE